jgi:molybdenum cofactor cytidylyltransferase
VAGHRAEDVQTEARRLGLRCVVNHRYDEGMFTSFQAGVRAVPGDATGFFVLPVDCALVRPESVGRLARAAQGSCAAAIYPTCGGVRGHPPLISTGLSDEILADRSPNGLRGVLERHAERTVDVETDDPGILRDMDGDDDVAPARRYAARETVPDDAGCEELLRRQLVPPQVVEHCRAVAAVAQTIGAALNGRGQYLCLSLLRAGALLHDVARTEANHAEAGASLLDDLG